LRVSAKTRPRRRSARRGASAIGGSGRDMLRHPPRGPFSLDVASAPGTALPSLRCSKIRHSCGHCGHAAGGGSGTRAYDPNRTLSVSAKPPFGPCVGRYPITLRSTVTAHPATRRSDPEALWHLEFLDRRAKIFSRATRGLSNVVAEPNGQRSETILVGRASLHDSSRLANTTL
jgi:hypothetical protein